MAINQKQSKTCGKRTIHPHNTDIASEQSQKSNRAQENPQNQQRPTDSQSQINTDSAYAPSLNSGKLEMQGLNNPNHLELKCLDRRQLSLSDLIMKKLIGLLGAAGLLIPSAAMAGNIGVSSGSSAMRATGTSQSYTHVSVDSSFHRTADIHVGGMNHGVNVDVSAENATVGHRSGNYSYDQTTGNAAAAADAEVGGGYGRVGRHAAEGFVEGAAEGDVTTTTTHLPGTPGDDGHCWRGHCWGQEDPTPSVTTTETEGEGEFELAAGGERSSLHGHGGYVEAEGYLNGGYDDQNIGFTHGTGGEYFANGSISGSIDNYVNGYHGTLTETGDTHTSVDAFTSANSTSRGFESGSFSSTEWN